MTHKTASALLVVTAVGLTTLIATASSPEQRAAAVRDTRTPVELGAYLVKTMGCHDCHTPWTLGPKGPEPDMTRALTGHPEALKMPPAPALPAGPWIATVAATNTAWAGPWGVSFTANLTPDKETGLGDWTEEQFIAALRTGKHQGKGRADPAADAVCGLRAARGRGNQSAVGVSAVAGAGEQPRAAAGRSARREPAVTTRVARALLLAAACAWAGAVAVRAGGAAAAAAAVPQGPPALLSETGLYADPASLAIDGRNRPFTPQYPLWSDGAEKRRWVRLPDGAAIDARALDHWDFPIGTRFWKEFSFAGRRVETRMFWKTAADHWEFASYAWDDDQRDATLAPPAGLSRVAEVAPGKWHNIPSHEECRACHDSGRTEVLGFNALQLSDDRDPRAPHAEALTPHMVTLGSLVREGRVTGMPTGLAASPPRVDGRTPVERAVLGYLSTNCGSCHNRESSIASLGLFLKYTLDARGQCGADALVTTLDQVGHWLVPEAPEGTSRVVAPGQPARSALLRRATSRRPSSQMPPIGTVVADREALALVTQWIDGLDGASMAPCPSSRETRSPSRPAASRTAR